MGRLRIPCVLCLLKTVGCRVVTLERSGSSGSKFVGSDIMVGRLDKGGVVSSNVARLSEKIGWREVIVVRLEIGEDDL